MNIGPELTDVASAVQTALTLELDSRRAQLVSIDPALGADIDRLADFVLTGGKRIRPAFLCWGYLSASPELPGAAIRAAASLELIQACALLHDDIIDRSATRRGRPSTHTAVAKAHSGDGWAGDSEHYGVSVALLLGDLALAWADDMFTTAAAELGGLDRSLPAWRAMRSEVLGGQLLDLRASADLPGDAESMLAGAMAVNRYKTAAYTVERPLHLGAALAGADRRTISALRAYGADIGIAFQLRDDLLGVFGDPLVTGKPTGDDLIEGKQTVLLALTRQALAGRPVDLADLDRLVGSPMTPFEVDQVTALIASTGAIDQVEARIDALFRSGTAALGARPTHDPASAQRAPVSGEIPDRTVGALLDLALACTARSI